MAIRYTYAFRHYFMTASRRNLAAEKLAQGKKNP